MALALGCLLVLALAGGTQARATSAQTLVTCDPTTTNDTLGAPGSTSLRDCVRQLNNPDVGGGTIDLQPGAGYEVVIQDLDENGKPVCDGSDLEDAAATGDLDVSSNITINGNGAFIDGLCSRVFEVLASGNLTLKDVRVSGGFACESPSGTGGGGILNEGTLTLNNATVSGNISNCRGAGIENTSGATATLNNSTVSGNSSPNGGGGGIYNQGTLNLNGSTVSGNDGHGGGGGGIANHGGTLNAVASTFAGNIGSGLYQLAGQATLQNVTIAHNSSSSTRAGGIQNGDINQPGSGGTISIVNTIVAANDGGRLGHPEETDCEGDSFAGSNYLGHNLFGPGGTTACPYNPDKGDILTGSPGLGPLGRFTYIGTPNPNPPGPTETVPLAAGSPAIDAGDAKFFRGTDERGIAGQGELPDLGAFEFVPTEIQPHASFTFDPPEPFDNEDVTFTNQSTSGCDCSSSNWWDLGDGQFTDVRSPTHSYSSPGTYPVTLELADSGGAVDWTTKDVPVQAAVTIDKTADQESVNAGKPIGFTVTITNHTSDPQTGLNVSDVLPGGSGVNWTLDADHSSPGWRVNTNEEGVQSLDLDSEHSSLPGDASTTAHVVSATTAQSCGEYDNTAEFESDQESGVASASTTVNGCARDLYVDARWKDLESGTHVTGPDGQDLTIGDDAFGSIHEALDALTSENAGSTVHVAAGSYDETEQSLDLAQDGDHLLGAGSGVTHVHLDQLEVDGANTVVDGFDLIGPGTWDSELLKCTGCTIPVVRLGGDQMSSDESDVPQNATISNNKISGGSRGIDFSGGSESVPFPTSGSTASDNDISHNVVGVYVNSGPGNVIENNSLDENGNKVAGSGPQASILIVDNQGLESHRQHASRGTRSRARSTTGSRSERTGTRSPTTRSRTAAPAIRPSKSRPGSSSRARRQTRPSPATTLSGNTISGSAFAGIKLALRRLQLDRAQHDQRHAARRGERRATWTRTRAARRSCITGFPASNTTITHNQIGMNSGFGILQAASEGTRWGTSRTGM